MALQTPTDSHFDDLEEGMLPQVPRQSVQTGYTKQLSFNYARDTFNNIWRKLKSDSAGNLKVKLSTQGVDRPLPGNTNLTAVFVLVLPANPKRSSVIIFNNSQSGITFADSIQLKYNLSSASPDITIMPGYMLIEDNWSGDIFMKSALTDPMPIRWVEYF